MAGGAIIFSSVIPSLKKLRVEHAPDLVVVQSFVAQIVDQLAGALPGRRYVVREGSCAAIQRHERAPRWQPC